MISNFVRRYIARPLALAAQQIPLEPVFVASLLLQGVTFFRDQLQGGADLETALTMSIVALGTWVVRENVWPDAKIDSSTQTPLEQLDAPVVGGFED